MKESMYITNVKSKEEFLVRFEKLLDYFEKKERTSAEKVLYKTLVEVQQNIYNKKILDCKKESYSNMLPYFELGGGWEMMESEIGKEATELLYYFVQNY
jgi:hypothetical protein